MSGPWLPGVDSPKALRALPEEALVPLCQEVREAIIAICGKVGGHLGASLGAVELIVALHRVFKSPQDRIVFDVGHQAYAHKLLTGRAQAMGTLRQEGGVAPFLDPSESEHDAFAAGHACTALSAALGLLEGKELAQDAGKVVAVVGDGALTGGLSFEALNNVPLVKRPLVVVLNDNQMSISVNVGAIPQLLESSAARRFFEALGLNYLGPVDGHDVQACVEAFSEARRALKPTLVHVRTQKGKGLPEAEEDLRTRGHAMGPFEYRAGKLVRSRGGQKTFSDAFAEGLAEQMAADPAVVCITPAMLEGSALTGLKEAFPDRVFDVGIAEQHAVTFAAGLALAGQKPVVCIYSTFLQRAYDSVMHDVCLKRLPVVFAVDRAGLVGADGATHQGSHDVSFLRALPGMTVAAPAFGEDLAALLSLGLSSDGPFAIRFPRGTLPEVPPALPKTKGLHARWLSPVRPTRAAIVALGPLALPALAAASRFEGVGVLDARFASPLDEEALLSAAASGRVLFVEEGTLKGGFSSAALELYADRGVRPRVKRLGLPDAFVPHGDARAQRQKLGLDEEGISAALASLLSTVPAEGPA